VRRLAQCERAAREIASGSTDKLWLELQAVVLKTVNAMAVRLRIGAKAQAGLRPVNAAVAMGGQYAMEDL
jgi:hypothetical protein